MHRILDSADIATAVDQDTMLTAVHRTHAPFEWGELIAALKAKTSTLHSTMMETTMIILERRQNII